MDTLQVGIHNTQYHLGVHDPETWQARELV